MVERNLNHLTGHDRGIRPLTTASLSRKVWEYSTPRSPKNWEKPSNHERI
jgi:hypothetical protein